MSSTPKARGNDGHQCMEEILEQVLRYRPDEPLKFIVRLLDEMINHDSQDEMRCERLRLVWAQKNSERLLDEMCSVYTSCEAQCEGENRVSYARNKDIIILARSLCPFLCPLIEKRYSISNDPLSFDIFCTILRFILTYQAIEAELFLLFEDRSQIRLVDAHFVDETFAHDNFHPMNFQFPTLKHFLRRFVSEYPRSYHATFTKVDLQKAILFDYALPDLDHLLLTSSSSLLPPPR
mmetsp:Transcript_13193/g.19750  ORF Transcript_13193/g.19750 Transcript_13193/m.19750 type:complete len:236 (+) Transcript_13193:29-736(+)